MATLRQSLDQTQEIPSEGTQDSASIDPVAPPLEMSAQEAALYQRGLQHLQAGEWAEAIESLSELVEQHPEQPYYAELLEQARLKARLDEHRPRRRKSRSLAHSRRVWVLTILALVMWLAVLGRQIYERQIVPALEQRELVARQEELLQEGNRLLAAGQFDQAAEYFEEVLALDPENAAARRALEGINKRGKLAQTYDNAMSLIEQEKWDAALTALEAIRQEAPDFRDVQQQVERVRKLRGWANTFQAATQAFQSGDWPRAVELLLSLRQKAPTYKPEEVTQLLFQSYMKQAEAALLDPGESPEQEIEQIQTAINFFKQALEVDPSNAEAATQFELAQEYLAGLQAFRRSSWESAVIHLTSIYPLAPDYLDGRAAELLQRAYVQAGNEYHRQEEYAQAAERYRQAIALGLAGSARPLPKEAAPLLQAADNLAQEARFQAAAAAYGDLLDMLGFEVIASGAPQPGGEELARQRPPASQPPAGSGTAAPQQTETEPAEAIKPEPTPSAEIYIVRPGDTLSKIAQRFNTTVEALVKANNIIRDPNLIRPGWRLLIPPS